MLPRRKKSTCVRSGDVGGQAIGPALSNPTIVVTGGGMLTVNRLLLSVSLGQQQAGIFERTRQSLVRRRQLCIAVGGCTFERLL